MDTHKLFADIASLRVAMLLPIVSVPLFACWRQMASTYFAGGYGLIFDSDFVGLCGLKLESVAVYNQSLVWLNIDGRKDSRSDSLLALGRKG